MKTTQSNRGSSATRIAVTALAACVLMLTGCRFATNRTIVGAGNGFDASWEAAHEAVQMKGYTIASEDRVRGEIVTVKRTNKDWWWVMYVTVRPDGTAEFLCRGSPNVNPEPKIHRRLLNFSVKLQQAFEQALARGS